MYSVQCTLYRKVRTAGPRMLECLFNNRITMTPTKKQFSEISFGDTEII